MKELLARLKYGRELSAARTLELELANLEACRLALRSDLDVDLVVPMPIGPWRRWRRGFNQVEQLAGATAAIHGLPLDLQALGRRDGLRQVGKSREARRRFDARVFRCRAARVQGRRVLLIDDVVTTGATIRAAARVLRRHGAISVRVLVVARTPDSTSVSV